MDVGNIIPLTLNAVSYSALLFLVSAGLSLIFGVMHVVNLAHGSFFMLGAYVGLSVMKSTGNFLLAVLAGTLTVTVVGWVIERFFLRNSMISKREADQVLLTFAFVFIFMDAFKWGWGTTPQLMAKPELLAGSVPIGDLLLSEYRLAMIGVGAALALGLWLMLEKTRMGAIIRAGVDDSEMVSGLAINVSSYFRLVFCLGALLAGFAGVLSAPVLGAQPSTEFEMLALGLVVVVIGGLGSLGGALIGAFVVGFADIFGKVLLPELAMMIIYLVMAVVLVFYPKGILGKKEG